MELEITDRKENILLDRKEVRFVVRHQNEATPKRDIIRGEISKELKVPKENVVIDSMDVGFGKTSVSGYARVYNKKETALVIEKKHLLVRNQLMEKQKKEEKKKEAAPKKR